MHLTFIVTIDPVKDLPLLNILIHSFNLQTSKTFDVVFYNQTPLEESEVFARLEVSPQFGYRWFGIEKEDLLGKYPIWDLYGLHALLLEHGLVGDRNQMLGGAEGQRP